MACLACDWYHTGTGALKNRLLPPDRSPPPCSVQLLELDYESSAVRDHLHPRVYEELIRIARAHLAREHAGHNLEAADLVHEAYIRVLGRARVEWLGPGHFYAVTSRAIRRILVDHARRRRTIKRGGAWRTVPLEEETVVVELRADRLAELEQALERLALLDERLCRVVEYRFFGGLSEVETAAALGVTDRTVRRRWLRARAWLYRELTG